MLNKEIAKLEQDCVTSHNKKCLYEDWLAGIEKIIKLQEEIESNKKRAENGNRHLKTLTAEEENLKQINKVLKNQIEELESEKHRLQEEYETLERKTKNLSNIEGLSIEEKEKHSQNLKQNLENSLKEKERVLSKLKFKKEEIKRLVDIYSQCSEKINLLHNQYRSNLQNIVQQASNPN